MKNSEKIKVVFIDDGISDKYIIGLKECKIKHYVSQNNQILPSKGADHLSHGTLCCSVFLEYAINYEILDVCVFSDKNVLLNILNAFEWCLKCNVNIICISIGSYSYHVLKSFKSYIENLHNKKILVIAAASNIDRVCFPACMEHVVGVRHNNNLSKGKIEYCINPFDGIEIQANLPEKVNFLNKLVGDYQEDIVSNSLIVPYIAATLSFFYDSYIKTINIKKWINQVIQNVYYNSFNLEYLKRHISKTESQNPVLYIDPTVEEEWVNQLIDGFKKREYTVVELNNKNLPNDLMIDIRLAKSKSISLTELLVLIEYIFSSDIVVISCRDNPFRSEEYMLVSDVFIYNDKIIIKKNTETFLGGHQQIDQVIQKVINTFS